MPHAEANSPQLTWAGDFRVAGSDDVVATHDPCNQYYLGCVACGTALDRRAPIEQHRQPMLLKQRKWSFRISQLAIGAIELSQIVGRFQAAVADPEEMVVFRCDVLGLPRSTCQALTPVVLERARSVEVFELAARVREGAVAFGGLDMGDRCWLFARESVRSDVGRVPSPGVPDVGQVASPGAGLGNPAYSRLLAAERMAAAEVVARAQRCFGQLGLTALFIDERPLVNEARTIALALNGLQALPVWPRIPNERDAYITLPGGLTWDGKNSRWLNLKCAVVRFTKNKLGAGIEQSLVFFEEGGQTKFVPCIACNRFETIDRVVRELLTPAEGVSEFCRRRGDESGPGGIRETPGLLLPRMTPGDRPILEAVEAHLITGSEREREADGTLGDYVAGCDNHLLLADGYSALAAVVCGGDQNRFASGPGVTFDDTPRSRVVAMISDRSVLG